MNQNYKHTEELVIHSTPTKEGHSNKIKKSIHYHSSTKLQLSNDITTPFPTQIIDLYKTYPFINRTLIQIGSSSLFSSSSNTWNDCFNDRLVDDIIFPSQHDKSINGLSIYINYNQTMLSANNNVWNDLLRSLLGKKVLCASLTTSNNIMEQLSDSSYVILNENNYWKMVPSREPITPECMNSIQSLLLPCGSRYGLYPLVYNTMFHSINDHSSLNTIVWVDINNYNSALHLDVGTIVTTYLNPKDEYTLNDIFDSIDQGRDVTACPLAHDTVITTISSNDKNVNHFKPGSSINLSYTVPITPTKQQVKNNIRISRKIINYDTNKIINDSKGSIHTIIENTFDKMENVTLVELYPNDLFMPFYSTMNVLWYNYTTRQPIVNQEWNDAIIYNLQKSKNTTKSISILTLSNLTLPPQSILLYKKSKNTTKSISILTLSNLTLPPQSILLYKISYQPIHLPLEFTPLPPNYGIPLPPSILSIGNTKLYSPNVLYVPPTSDASMVFNVISFTCTFYAFVIGMVFNVLLKKGSDFMSKKVRKDDGGEKNTFLVLFKKIWRRVKDVDRDKKEQ